MQHLSEIHDLNIYVTTVTSHVRLHPSEADVYVTPTRLHEAVDKLGESGIGVKKSFKNCSIIRVAVNSKRASMRSHNVSVKIFKNMMLHITGAHSLEMIQVVVEKLSDILVVHTCSSPWSREGLLAAPVLRREAYSTSMYLRSRNR